MTRDEKVVDVEVTNHGSVFSFSLLTPAAEEWWAENVGDVPPVAEHRYAWDIAQGMLNDGLEVR